MLWYVAYGSNLHAARLDWYLRGGRPPGGLRTYPGCRDCRPPRRTVPALIPGGVYFAGESRAWTGGMAFYDPQLPGRAAARGYLVAVELPEDKVEHVLSVFTSHGAVDLDSLLARWRAEGWKDYDPPPAGSGAPGRYLPLSIWRPRVTFSRSVLVRFIACP